MTNRKRDVETVLNQVRSQLWQTAQRLQLDVRREGNSYKCRCPFHDDKRPSMVLYEDHYHCFPCSAHGDAIDLVKQVNNCDFLEAVEWLANQYGLRLPTKSPAVAASRKRQAAYELALQYAWELYRTAAGEDRERHIKLDAFASRRQLDRSVLEEWEALAICRGDLQKSLQRLATGYLPDKALAHSKNRDRTDLAGIHVRELMDVLRQAGLITALESRDGGQNKGQSALPFDVPQFKEHFYFSGIMLPIRDHRGRLVGLVVRADDDGAKRAPKYFYSPGFRKSAVLFGANRIDGLRTGDTVQRPLYIVEGIFDVIRMQSLGMAAVGVFGSDLHVDQLRILERLIDSADGTPTKNTWAPALFFDRDAAGRRGAAAAAELLGAEWCGQEGKYDRPPIIDPPGKAKDPDEYLSSLEKKLRGDRLQELLDSAQKPALPLILASRAGLLGKGTGYDESLQVLVQGQSRPYAPLLRRLLKSAPFDAQKRETWISALVWYVNDSRMEVLTVPKPDCAPVEILRQYVLRLGGDRYLPSGVADVAKAPVDGSTDRITAAVDSDRIDHNILARAFQLAECSPQRREVPDDITSWFRIRRAQDLFTLVVEERLTNPQIIDTAEATRCFEPFRATRTPKNKTKARLKAMPCAEDSVVQMYVLTALLQWSSQPDAAKWIPAVRYTRGRAGSWLHTTGRFHRDLINDLDVQAETVSFAYQVDTDAVDGFAGRPGASLFRHYSKCWRDYINHTIMRARRFRGEEIHGLRLDIRGFYDAIEKRVLDDALVEPLTKAFSVQVPAALRFLCSHDQSPRASAKQVVDWLCGQVMGYRYLDPNDGSVKLASPRGVAQGPDLSAWLANIALFGLDALMVAEVQKLDAAYRRQAGSIRVPYRSCAASYARYVDDIILFAPTRAELTRLRRLIAELLQHLGLELNNEKDEPLVPMSRGDFIRYIGEDRMLAPAYAADADPWCGDCAVATDLRGRPIAGRKGFLAQLFSIGMEPLSSADGVKERLRNLIKDPGHVGLRQTDYVAVCAQLWRCAALEHPDAKELGGKFLTDVRDLFDQYPPPFERPDGVAKEDSHAWQWVRIQIYLEALERVLVQRPDLNPTASQDQIATYESARVGIATAIRWHCLLDEVIRTGDAHRISHDILLRAGTTWLMAAETVRVVRVATAPGNAAQSVASEDGNSPRMPAFMDQMVTKGPALARLRAAIHSAITPADTDAIAVTGKDLHDLHAMLCRFQVWRSGSAKPNVGMPGGSDTVVARVFHWMIASTQQSKSSVGLTVDPKIRAALIQAVVGASTDWTSAMELLKSYCMPTIAQNGSELRFVGPPPGARTPHLMFAGNGPLKGQVWHPGDYSLIGTFPEIEFSPDGRASQTPTLRQTDIPFGPTPLVFRRVEPPRQNGVDWGGQQYAEQVQWLHDFHEQLIDLVEDRFTAIPTVLNLVARPNNDGNGRPEKLETLQLVDATQADAPFAYVRDGEFSLTNRLLPHQGARYWRLGVVAADLLGHQDVFLDRRYRWELRSVFHASRGSSSDRVRLLWDLLIRSALHVLAGNGVAMLVEKNLATDGEVKQFVEQVRHRLRFESEPQEKDLLPRVLELMTPLQCLNTRVQLEEESQGLRKPGFAAVYARSLGQVALPRDIRVLESIGTVKGQMDDRTDPINPSRRDVRAWWSIAEKVSALAGASAGVSDLFKLANALRLVALYHWLRGLALDLWFLDGRARWRTSPNSPQWTIDAWDLPDDIALVFGKQNDMDGLQRPSSDSMRSPESLGSREFDDKQGGSLGTLGTMIRNLLSKLDEATKRGQAVDADELRSITDLGWCAMVCVLGLSPSNATESLSDEDMTSLQQLMQWLSAPMGASGKPWDPWANLDEVVGASVGREPWNRWFGILRKLEQNWDIVIEDDVLHEMDSSLSLVQEGLVLVRLGAQRVQSDVDQWRIARAESRGARPDDLERVPAPDDSPIRYRASATWARSNGAEDNRLVSIAVVDRLLASAAWLADAGMTDSDDIPPVSSTETVVADREMAGVLDGLTAGADGEKTNAAVVESRLDLAATGDAAVDFDTKGALESDGGASAASSTEVPSFPQATSTQTLHDPDGAAIESSASSPLSGWFEKQKQLWNVRRKDRPPVASDSRLRVALFQWLVDECYSDPANELSDKATPTVEQDSNKNVVLRTFRSRKEWRRRKLLSRAIEICEQFGVDLLLLPEYSVRPETVDWIFDVLRGHIVSPQPDIGGRVQTAIWAGTSLVHRHGWHLPGSSDQLVGWNSSVLVALIPPREGGGHDEVKTEWRAKKYAASGVEETFRPGVGRLDPLYQRDPLPRNDNLGYVTELICSEAFIVTAPANLWGIAKYTRDLGSRYAPLGQMASFEVIRNELRDDMVQVGWVLSPENSERRSILLVPAFSSRASDYHALARTNCNAANVITVFCNAANGESWSKGQSGVGVPDVRPRSKEFPTDTPYHGAEPGLLRAPFPMPSPAKRKNGENQALGEKEQAIVIVDIDPRAPVDTKPTPQAGRKSVRLVAHIPVFEYQTRASTANETRGSAGPANDSPSPANELAQRAAACIDRHCGAQQSGDPAVRSAARAEIETFLDHLAKIVKDSPGLTDRAVAFRNRGVIDPHYFPAAIVDWTVVQMDYPPQNDDLPEVSSGGTVLGPKGSAAPECDE